MDELNLKPCGVDGQRAIQIGEVMNVGMVRAVRPVATTVMVNDDEDASLQFQWLRKVLVKIEEDTCKLLFVLYCYLICMIIPSNIFI